MKTMYFSETIAGCDLKVGRSRKLIKFCTYVSIRGQGNFLTLAQGLLHTKIETCFSQKQLGPFKPFFVCKLLLT